MQNEVNMSMGEILDKSKEVMERTFLIGDVPSNEQIKEVVASGLPDAKILIKAGLALIYNHIPESSKNMLKEYYFTNLPLDVDEVEGYKILNKIGSGGMNTVYLISEDQEVSYALAIKKQGFENSATAIDFAKKQRTEYEYFKSMYKSIPELIQQESYAVFERYDHKPSIMFIREFMEGPLRDVFQTNREEIVKILNGNPALKDSLRTFTEVTLENKGNILDLQLDLLGLNNLCIAGKEGYERLILLDPHTIEKKTFEYRQKILDNINYLEELSK